MTASSSASSSSSLSSWRTWLFAPIDGAIFGLLRLFFGLSAVCKFTGMTSPLPRLVKGGFELGLPLHRYTSNHFTPGVLGNDVGLLPPTLQTYRDVETAALVVAVFVVLGLGSRVSTLVFSACCWWLLLVDPAGFKHNLFALAVFGVLIAVSPCGDRFSVDAWLLRRLRGPRVARLQCVFWLRLVQVQIAIIYLFSTAVKLNEGWATGHLLGGGRDKTAARAVDAGLELLVPLITWRPFYALASWVTVAVEAFLIVGFFPRRTRAWALFLGVCLHTGIDLGVDVGSYSLTMFAVYVAFLSPAARQHRLDAPAAIAWSVRALDWFCRFDVVTGPTLRYDQHETRPGEVRRQVLLRLPLTFPFAFAVDRLDRARRAWRTRRGRAARVIHER